MLCLSSASSLVRAKYLQHKYWQWKSILISNCCAGKGDRIIRSRCSLLFFSPPIASAFGFCPLVDLLAFVLFLFFNVADHFCVPEYYDGWPFWLWQLQGVLVWPQVHPVRWQSLLHPMLRQPVLKHLRWVQRANRPWRKGEAPIFDTIRHAISYLLHSSKDWSSYRISIETFF